MSAVLTWKLRMCIASLFIWFWFKFHPCRIGRKEYDHEMTYIDDTYGDAGVINGICHCGHWECERCGYVPDEQDAPPSYDDWAYIRSNTMNNLTRSFIEYLDDQLHRYPRAFLICAVIVGFAVSEIIDRALC